MAATRTGWVRGDVRARAVQFTAPGRIDLVSVDLPEQVSSTDLIVRSVYSGISAGTEMLAYRGELDADISLDESLSGLSGSFDYPFRYGYSCVGRVEQGTAMFPAGSMVFAFHPHQDRFVVADRDAVLLEEGADARLATLFPLVETALQLTLDAGPGLDETVVVTGLGAVGLLTALLLRRAGAAVLAAEPREWRREIAAALGITAVPPERLPALVAEATAGRGTPMLLELSGAPAALAEGLAILAPEGSALVGSWYGTKRVSLSLGSQFHRRRLTIRSSQVSSIPAALRGRWDLDRRRATVRRLLAELPLQVLATSEFPFADAASAYAAVDRGEPGLLHAALRYE
ncbi:MAG TPA: zinc-binding alcohol dehydrogenase [Actinomycetes bacterium]|nr:zinc-binding alcohol dehydrogenase [Actinomycetes bacterium]